MSIYLIHKVIVNIYRLIILILQINYITSYVGYIGLPVLRGRPSRLDKHSKSDMIHVEQVFVITHTEQDKYD